MRKLISLVAVVALMLPLAPSASAAWPTNAECDHGTYGNYFGGLRNQSNVGTWITSVYGQIYTDTSRFQPCTGPIFNEVSGGSQWIAIDAPSAPGDNSIIQIGVIKCGINYTVNVSTSPCYPGRNNTLRFFYAYGHEDNCELDPGVKHPYAMDLGPASLLWHSFQITRSRNVAAYYFFIDGVKLNFSIPEYKVCWANNPQITRADWDVERWDPGDGFGAAPASFDGTAYAHDLGSLVASKWWSTSDCNLDPEFHCSGSGQHWGFWTTQQ